MKRIVMALAGGGGIPAVNRRMTAPCDMGIYAGRDLPFRHPQTGHVTGDGASAYGMACIPSINENLEKRPTRTRRTNEHQRDRMGERFQTGRTRGETHAHRPGPPHGRQLHHQTLTTETGKQHTSRSMPS